MESEAGVETKPWVETNAGVETKPWVKSAAEARVEGEATATAAPLRIGSGSSSECGHDSDRSERAKFHGACSLRCSAAWNASLTGSGDPSPFAMPQL
jgi:hypothetical protein